MQKFLDHHFDVLTVGDRVEIATMHGVATSTLWCEVFDRSFDKIRFNTIQSVDSDWVAGAPMYQEWFPKEVVMDRPTLRKRALRFDQRSASTSVADPMHVKIQQLAQWLAGEGLIVESPQEPMTASRLARLLKRLESHGLCVPISHNARTNVENVGKTGEQAIKSTSISLSPVMVKRAGHPRRS